MGAAHVDIWILVVPAIILLFGICEGICEWQRSR